jgi:hypothetical protein
MKNFENTLKGGDLRSIGKANDIVKEVNNKNDFDSLFTGLFHEDRKVVMRAADAIEKITITNPEYLADHKKEILGLLQTAKHIELKWHLALLISRLALTEAELGEVWQILTCRATDKTESRIVRVNSVQGLYELLQGNQALEQDFNLTIDQISKENIPSINARIRKLQKKNR